MAKHLALGESGEDLAARFLGRKGMTLVARRVRCRGGELDLVVRDGREWVFVEVKTRTGNRMGTASEAFTPRKSGRMRKAVIHYVAANALENEPIRCDLVAIDIAADGVPEITHFPGGITWT